MESGHCRACGLDADRTIVKRLPNGTAVTRCRACSVTALTPLPTTEELNRHYSDYYLTRSNDAERQRRLVDLHRPIFGYLTGHLQASPPYSFLDYGFGSGAFLQCVAELGHVAVGADVSAQNRQQLEAICRHQALAIRLVDLSPGPEMLTGMRFDVITLFQVLEHVADPLTLARHLSRLQAPGGLLYVECPNDPSALGRVKNLLRVVVSRPIWRSLKYPEHLHGFNRRAIRTLLTAAGYHVIDCGDYSYRDGIHQVESEFWWPPFRENPSLRTLYGLSRSVVPLFDRLMAASLHAGSGLFALGRKSDPTCEGRQPA